MPRQRRSFRFYDPSSRTHGPYELTPSNLQRVPRSPGVYLLVRFYEDGSHRIVYVGRHFRDVGARLSVYKHGPRQTHFYFKTTGNKVDTYLTECDEFHRYGGKRGLLNMAHPNRPKGYDGPKCSSRSCPCR